MHLSTRGVRLGVDETPIIHKSEDTGVSESTCPSQLMSGDKVPLAPQKAKRRTKKVEHGPTGQVTIKVALYRKEQLWMVQETKPKAWPLKF